MHKPIYRVEIVVLHESDVTCANVTCAYLCKYLIEELAEYLRPLLPGDCALFDVFLLHTGILLHRNADSTQKAFEVCSEVLPIRHCLEFQYLRC